MKILFLGFSKIAYMPYMHYYLNLVKNHDVDLIYWDRDGHNDSKVPEGFNNTYKFEYHLEEHISILRKMPAFIKYRHFAKKIIKKNKYDYIILLHSTPGLTIIDLLYFRYANKFILDYRDFSHENISFYKKLVHILINKSSATFVSSAAFRKYLPQIDKIYNTHNILLDSLEHSVSRFNQTIRYPIRISYWGLIRHTKVNLAIINKLANDERFELHYYGREQETARILKSHCLNKVNNVFFHGEYLPNERYDFAKSTDILHNIYENDAVTINALGNKYYDGIALNIPQICTKGSFMGDMVMKEGVGQVFDPYQDDFVEQLMTYYTSLNRMEFEDNCMKALQNVMKEYEEGIIIINNLLLRETK